MTTVRARMVVAAAVLSAAGCTTGGTAFGPPVRATNIAKSAKLQLAVGTATIAYNGGSALGMNFVVTFRGADGNNATGANTPTLTGPPGFNFGPLLGGSNSIAGVLPSDFNAAVQNFGKNGGYPVSYGEGFGPFTGAFGYGFASNNTVSGLLTQQLVAEAKSSFGVCPGIAGGVSGGSLTVETDPFLPAVNGGHINYFSLSNVAHAAALGLPIPSGSTAGGNVYLSTCPNQAVQGGPFDDQNFPVNYYGGPPAWPSPQGYGSPGFFLGYPLGFTDFVAAPVPGKYSLDVAYATSADYSTYGHAVATATLASTAALPPISAPALTANSDGSGFVIVSIPPGLTEAVVLVRAPDCDLTVQQPDNYAVVVHSSGRQIVTFSSNLGPPDAAGHPKHTFCTASDIAAFNASQANVPGFVPIQIPTSFGPALVTVVGFDYPAYEASYPFNMQPAPVIANASGRADITTSYPSLPTYTITGPGATGSSRVHR